jgi:hypothetical protein
MEPPDCFHFFFLKDQKETKSPGEISTRSPAGELKQKFRPLFLFETEKYKYVLIDYGCKII